jgi:ferredoxin-NADP reductase
MNLILTKKRHEAKNIKTFYFQRNSNFDYLPGQYIYLTHPELKFPDNRGPTRHFTISSSPTQKNEISITTKIRQGSGFKKTLDSLKIGAEIEAEGPTGTFILDNSENGLNTLIAGGIGITPFRSFLRYNFDNKLEKIKLTLIYSIKTPQDNVFSQEFKQYEKQSKNISINTTITRPAKALKWNGLTGTVDGRMIKSLITDYKKSTFWLCGPPGMVDATEKILDHLYIDPGQVRVEKFTGY